MPHVVNHGCARLLAILSATLIACSSPNDPESPAPPTATQPDNASTIGVKEPDDKGTTEQPATTEDAAVMPSDTAPPVEDPPAEPKCGEAPFEPPSTPAAPKTMTYPEIKHWEIPTDNVVALTFDDGPKPSTTNKILDVLKAEKVRATFFISSRATSDLRTDPAAQETLRRIVAEGHVLGNHTASHYDLRTASVDVEAQLRFVEEDIKLAAPCAPPITLVRTPFGQPQLAGTEEERARVIPILARHGVHIGWTIESFDDEPECTALGAKCLVDKVRYRLDRGKRGSILMHDTQPVTVDALPLIIAELRKRGIGMVTAEKLVRDKFGKPSSELLVK